MPAHVDLVGKVPSGQGPGACGEFGKRSSDGPRDVPAEARGCEQRQQSRKGNYYYEAPSGLLSIFNGLGPLLQYLLVNSLHER